MSRLSLLLGLSFLVACSYYDSSLLAPTGETSAGEGGEAGEAGESGAGGDAGGVVLGGNGGETSGAAGQGGAGGDAGAAGQAGVAGQAGAGVPIGTETQFVGCAVKPIGPPKEKPAKADGVEFLLGLREVDIGEAKVNGESLYKGYGFDLDGYCSCPDDYTCKGIDPDPSRYCDGPEGRDNAGGALITSFSTLLPDFGSSSINDSFTDGSSTLLLQLSGYNGEADDDQVQVSWLLGEDFKQSGAKPQWKGEDVWPVQRASFLNEGALPLEPKSTDKNAYVRGFVLVATLPEGSLESDGFSVALTAPVVVATLVPPDDAQPYWHIESGTLAARWRAKDILGQLRRVNDPLSGKPLCTDNQFYPNVKAEICKYADISSGVQTQPNIPCDALSIALRFKATQVKLGGLVEVGPPDVLCPPATDPANDSCDP